MLRRAHFWDYHDPRIYMVTLTLSDRSHPLLGELIFNPVNSPESVQAFIKPSPLGLAVTKCWNTIPILHPEIQLIDFQLMEEHLHGILHVKQRLQRALGNIIGSFKSVCTSAFRKMFHDTYKCQQLFSPGFQDTILSGRGHLERMIHYIKDNPRRAAIKRLFPNFFQRLRKIPFGNGFFTGIGNAFLLDSASFYQIQASRRISDFDYQQKQEEMINAIYHNAIVVSPCISPAERQLARMAFDMKTPLIILKDKGFPPLFKPSGAYFDACAAGRLLMLAPSQWPFTPGKKIMTRLNACVLNALAQQICGKQAAEIHYEGITPQNLSELIAKAMRP